jgi:hypothetical protein
VAIGAFIPLAFGRETDREALRRRPGAVFNGTAYRLADVARERPAARFIVLGQRRNALGHRLELADT